MATNSESIINEKAFMSVLQKEMTEGMRVAAEPILKKALEDIEKEMRTKLGCMVIGFIDSYMEVERMGHTIRIIVRHDK